MKGVTSFKRWGKVVGTRNGKLSDVLTMSDEAWFLLVVENYEEAWKVEMKLVEVDEFSSKPVARWTGKDKYQNRRGKGEENDGSILLFCFGVKRT